MSEKQYKTSQAQRNAIKAYREKNGNKYATISITLTKEEAAAHRQTLAEHNRKPVDIWRDAIERLNAQPIPAAGIATAESESPATQSATPDGIPDGDTGGANG